MDNKKSALYEAASIVFLTEDNCKFFAVGEFIGADITEGGEVKHCARVWLHRSFPYDMPWSYISVQDKDSEEIGLIKSVDDFPADTAELIKKELQRKYYMPKIKRIISLKNAPGVTFWKCDADTGELSFTVQDTSRSISKIGKDKAFITDVCGNRYEIEALSALDRRSMRKLEIYL